MSKIQKQEEKKEVNKMKENKVWGLVMGQGRIIFTTFISSFFIGTNISMFLIGFYSYNIYNALNTVFNVNKAFKMYEVQNIVYSLIRLYMFSYHLYHYY